jgi:DNA topoisomerase VI subunit B
VIFHMCPDIDSELRHASNVARKFLELLERQIDNKKEPEELKKMAKAAKIMGEALQILIEDIKACSKEPPSI